MLGLGAVAGPSRLSSLAPTVRNFSVCPRCRQRTISSAYSGSAGREPSINGAGTTSSSSTVRNVRPKRIDRQKQDSTTGAKPLLYTRAGRLSPSIPSSSVLSSAPSSASSGDKGQALAQDTPARPIRDETRPEGRYVNRYRQDGPVPTKPISAASVLRHMIPSDAGNGLESGYDLPTIPSPGPFSAPLSLDRRPRRPPAQAQQPSLPALHIGRADFQQVFPALFKLNIRPTNSSSFSFRCAPTARLPPHESHPFIPLIRDATNALPGDKGEIGQMAHASATATATTATTNDGSGPGPGPENLVRIGLAVPKSSTSKFAVERNRIKSRFKAGMVLAMKRAEEGGRALLRGGCHNIPMPQLVDEIYTAFLRVPMVVMEQGRGVKPIFITAADRKPRQTRRVRN